MVWCLLLVAIVYGATFEFAHTHGKTFASVVKRNLSESKTIESEQPTAQQSATGGACLICQFQQQLGHGLAFETSVLRASELPVVLTPDAASIALQIRFISLYGRAPPACTLS